MSKPFDPITGLYLDGSGFANTEPVAPIDFSSEDEELEDESIIGYDQVTGAPIYKRGVIDKSVYVTGSENYRSLTANTAHALHKERTLDSVITKATGTQLYGVYIPFYATLTDFDYEALSVRVVNGEEVDRDLTLATYVKLPIKTILKHLSNGIPVRVLRVERFKMLQAVTNAVTKTSSKTINSSALTPEMSYALGELLKALNSSSTVSTLLNTGNVNDAKATNGL